MEEDQPNQPDSSEPPPVPAPEGQQPPPQPSVSVQPGAPLSEADSRLWGMLAHLLSIVGGFIAPLVIWLVFRERSAFVDQHGKESLNFQITVTIAFFVAGLLTYVCIGVILVPLVFVADLVFCIMAGLEANKGKSYKYPVTLRLIK